MTGTGRPAPSELLLTVVATAAVTSTVVLALQEVAPVRVVVAIAVVTMVGLDSGLLLRRTGGVAATGLAVGLLAVATGAATPALGVIATGVLLLLGAVGAEQGLRVGRRLLAVLATGTGATLTAMLVQDWLAGRRPPAALAAVAGVVVAVLSVGVARRVRSLSAGRTGRA